MRNVLDVRNWRQKEREREREREMAIMSYPRSFSYRVWGQVHSLTF